jgi:hypothetical protein
MLQKSMNKAARTLVACEGITEENKNAVFIFNLNTRELVQTIFVSKIRRLNFINKYQLVLADTMEIKIWDITLQQYTKTLKLKEGDLLTLCSVIGVGDYIVYEGVSHHFVVWNTNTGQCTDMNAEATVYEIQTIDSRRFASSQDDSVIVWSIDPVVQLFKFYVHDQRTVYSFELWTPTQLLCTAGCFLELWDFESKEKISTIQVSTNDDYITYLKKLGDTVVLHLDDTYEYKLVDIATKQYTDSGQMRLQDASSYRSIGGKGSLMLFHKKNGIVVFDVSKKEVIGTITGNFNCDMDIVAW